MYIFHSGKASELKRLEENIIWEPVDRQHVVTVCKLVQEKWLSGDLSTDEYFECFDCRQATSVVFDDRRFYINKLVQVNVVVWERELYSILEEDLRKLRQIWILYRRPDSNINADDKQRSIALMNAASATHRLHKINGKKLTIGKLANNMQDLTRHAWNPNKECSEVILCVYKDYKEGFLLYNKNEEEAWKKYATKNGLDPTMDV